MPRTLQANSSCGASATQRSRTASGARVALRPHRVTGKTSFIGQGLGKLPDNGSTRWSMAGTWLDNKAAVEVAAPLETCWALWDNRERIPEWMPWIKSVKIVESDPRLSRWTLSTNQFGRDWEFSWLARNLPPIKNTKIHWVSERGSASLGLEIQNRGQIKFVRTSPSSCNITLVISYEVPDVLVPFANALTPLVEGIIQKDMERFREMVTVKATGEKATTAA